MEIGLVSINFGYRFKRTGFQIFELLEIQVVKIHVIFNLIAKTMNLTVLFVINFLTISVVSLNLFPNELEFRQAFIVGSFGQILVRIGKILNRMNSFQAHGFKKEYKK
jgi:hypothetical protein